MKSFKVRQIQFDWDEIDKQYFGVLKHEDFILEISTHISYFEDFGPKIYLNLLFDCNNQTNNNHIQISINDYYTEQSLSYQSVIEQALNQLNEELHKRLELAKSSVQQLTSAIIKTL
jgi:hypothetical protein